MKKCIIALFLVLTSSFTYAIENLPEGYNEWPVIIDKTCGSLQITTYQGITLEAELQVGVYLYNGSAIAYQIYENTDTGEQTTAHGFYDGNWTAVEASQGDDVATRKQERLVKASLLQAGGADAIELLAGCEREIQKESMQEMMQSLHELGEELSDLFSLE